MRNHLLGIAVVAALAAPGHAVAQQTEGAILDTFVQVGSPRKVLEQIVFGGCETVFRTKLSNGPEDKAMEQALPGVVDRMIAASSAYCHENFDSAFVGIQASAREYWRTNLTADERARLLPAVRALGEDMKALDIRFQSGDTAGSAARRSASGMATPRADIAVAALIRTPAGMAAWEKYSALTANIQQVYSEPAGSLAKLIKGAKRAAYRAANIYARENKIGDIYELPNE